MGVDARRIGAAEAERALHERRTVATTGPLLQVSAVGVPVGAPLPAGRLVRVQLTAARTTPLKRVRLVGPTGTLQTWELSPGRPTLDVQLIAPELPWVLAIAEGDEAAPPLHPEPPWAITSPLFVP